VLIAIGVMCELGPHVWNDVGEIQLQIYISCHILPTVPVPNFVDFDLNEDCATCRSCMLCFLQVSCKVHTEIAFRVHM
jgi:hypothetical protein